jgi:hypothetical protein
MRRRGQKPSLPVLISDFRAGDIEGVMKLGIAWEEGQEYSIVGLRVVMLALKNPRNIEFAHRIAAAKPKALTVVWRSREDSPCEVQRVI